MADKFKSAIPLMNKLGLTRNPRVLLDFVASYWTVVLESEADSLEQFEREMETYMSKRSCGKRWPDTTT